MAIRPLTIRKLADRSEGERVPRWDPDTGEKSLINPATELPEPWPLAGVRIEDPPEETRVSTSFISSGKSQGWIELEGEDVAHRPGGPQEEPWRLTHTFIQADTVIFKTVDGDLRYEVVRNPDKWPEEKDGDLGFGGEVDWTYHLRLEG